MYHSFIELFLFLQNFVELFFEPNDFLLELYKLLAVICLFSVGKLARFKSSAHLVYLDLEF